MLNSLRVNELNMDNYKNIMLNETQKYILYDLMCMNSRKGKLVIENRSIGKEKRKKKKTGQSMIARVGNWEQSATQKARVGTF